MVTLQNITITHCPAPLLGQQEFQRFFHFSGEFRFLFVRDRHGRQGVEIVDLLHLQDLCDETEYAFRRAFVVFFFFLVFLVFLFLCDFEPREE